MFRSMPLTALVVASGASSLGATMTLIAVPWFVLVRTGSGTQTGLVAAAETLGLVLSLLCAGPLVDRYGARRGSVLADLCTCLAVLAIPLADALGVLSLPVLVGLVFMVGASRAPARSAKQVLLPAVIGATGIRVERATSAEETALRTGDLLGAPLGGVLIALVGPTSVLIADGTALIVSALLVGLLVTGAPVGEGAAAAGARGYLRELAKTAVQFRRDRLLLALGAACAAVNALTSGLLSVLLPAYGVSVWHNSTLVGVLIGAASGGSILGTVLYGWLSRGGQRWRTFSVCFLVSGAPVYGVVALNPHPLLLVPLVSLFMIANGPVNPVIAAVKYARVPLALRGRVFAAFSASANAAMPLGLLLAGALLDGMGPAAAAYVLGGVCLAISVCPFLFRIWRDMDAPDPEHGTPTPDTP
ncbi:MFS transporter [Streptomyces sp. NPDC056149]|uniref:MFS transporter n=1 Tax=unclassified Streptomyces TaxID=2593676 RepID=UPI0023816D56|nr:MFS transporter [Streptomyces sp. WZ-12]